MASFTFKPLHTNTMKEFYQTLDSLNTTQLVTLGSLASLAILEKSSLQQLFRELVKVLHCLE